MSVCRLYVRYRAPGEFSVWCTAHEDEERVVAETKASALGGSLEHLLAQTQTHLAEHRLLEGGSTLGEACGVCGSDSWVREMSGEKFCLGCACPW